MNIEVNLHDSAVFDMRSKSQFTSVYNLYYEQLCFYAHRYVGDADQAEDIIAELFAKLWQKPIVFADTEHLKAYLYRSTANACFTYVKALGSLKVREHTFVSQIDQLERDFLNDIIRTDLWAEVYRAIDNLPKQCSIVIRMSYVEGMKNPEIAEKLGLSLQTVKNHKNHGLRVLRNTLSKDAFYCMCFLVLSLKSL